MTEPPMNLSTRCLRSARAALAVVACAAALAGQAVAGAQDDLAAAEAAFRRGDFATTLQLVRPLAEQGNAEAQLSLATLYSRGAGVPRDYAEAIKWYRKSAEQGNVAAQYNLGAMYATGRGVEPDPAEGAKWLRRAADHGDGIAMYNLAAMYEKGEGVPRDRVEAWKWYSLAAKEFAAYPEKELRAIRGRDAAGRTLTPAQLARARKLASEWKRK
jgi:uncharacterized protein